MKSNAEKCMYRYHKKNPESKFYAKSYKIIKPNGQIVICKNLKSVSDFMGYSQRHCRRKLDDGTNLCGCKLERLYKNY